jgi:hypothetical protein
MKKHQLNSAFEKIADMGNSNGKKVGKKTRSAIMVVLSLLSLVIFGVLIFLLCFGRNVAKHIIYSDEPTGIGA